MKLAEAYQKLHKHFADKSIDPDSVSDDQFNAAVNELGLESVFSPKTENPVPPVQSQQQNNGANTQELAAAISQSLSQALKPINDKLNELDNARKTTEKEREEAAKTENQKEKQKLVDKLYSEKKISKEQRDSTYKDFVSDENFKLETLKSITATLPVNDAFAKPENTGSDNNNDDGSEEVKTGRFNPEEDWSKQSDKILDAARAEIESEIN